MADSIPKFRDINVRPPKGGWAPVIETITKISGVVAFSESDAIAFIAKWRKNNHTFVSMLDIEREIWSALCNQEPARCGISQAHHSRVGGDVTPREITPEVQGPPIWTFLNTLCASWTPGLQPYLVETCQQIGLILQCENCKFHWRETLVAYPPDSISSRYEACRWINNVHNTVNRQAGKSFFPYSEMVRLYGAPLN